MALGTNYKRYLIARPVWTDRLSESQRADLMKFIASFHAGKYPGLSMKRAADMIIDEFELNKGIKKGEKKAIETGTVVKFMREHSS